MNDVDKSALIIIDTLYILFQRVKTACHILENIILIAEVFNGFYGFDE
jgi:hypothetical protein